MLKKLRDRSQNLAQILRSFHTTPDPKSPAVKRGFWGAQLLSRTRGYSQPPAK